jgi:hypothetical protein
VMLSLAVVATEFLETATRVFQLLRNRFDLHPDPLGRPSRPRGCCPPCRVP